jgi:hypothetical protein
MGSFTFSDSPLKSEIQSGSGGITASASSVEVASIPSDVSQGDIVKVGLGDASAWGAENGELVYGTVGALGGGANGGTDITGLTRGLEESSASSWSEGTTARIGLQTTAQNQALSHDVRGESFVLEKALFDLERGNRSHLTVMSYGDSYPGRAFTRREALPSQIFPYLSDDYNANQFPYPGDRCGSFKAKEGTFSEATKDDHTIEVTGSYYTLSSGDEARFKGHADRTGLVLVQESGAGVAKIRVARGVGSLPGETSGDWRAPTASEIISGQSLDGNGDLTIDLDGSKNPVRVEFDFGSADFTAIQVLHESGGDVRMHRRVQFIPEVESSFILSHTKTGSWNPGNYLTAAQPFEVARLDIVEPDVIVVESDDGIDAYRSFLPKLRDLIDAANLGYDPYVVIVGIPHHKFDQDEKLKRNEYAASFCRKVGWDHVAAEELVGGLSGLEDTGYAGDEIHMLAEFWEVLAEVWADDRGIKAYRTRKPGGNTADVPDIASAQQSELLGAGQISERREITADKSPALASLPRIDSANMDWAAQTSGSGSYDESPAMHNEMNTGSTADSTVVAAINNTFGTPFGAKSRAPTENGIFAWSSIVSAPSLTANGKAFFICEDKQNDDPYSGSLTSEGFGFRLTESGSNVRVEGVYYKGGSQVVTSEAVEKEQGNWISIQAILTQALGNAGQMGITLLVNQQAIASEVIIPSTRFRTPYRFQVTNGSDASQFRVLFLKPTSFSTY